MSNVDPYDLPDDRVLHGPGGVRIAVPYKPPRRSEDIQRDFPPFDPPLVWVSNYEGEYREILRIGKIERDDHDYVFSLAQTDWFHSQCENIERMQNERRG